MKGKKDVKYQKKVGTLPKFCLVTLVCFTALMSFSTDYKLSHTSNKKHTPLATGFDSESVEFLPKEDSSNDNEEIEFQIGGSNINHINQVEKKEIIRSSHSRNARDVRGRILKPQSGTLKRLSRFDNRQKYRGIALRRSGDPAINYMKRKEAFLQVGFSMQLYRFGGWSKCHEEFTGNRTKYRSVDAYLCLSKSYCFDEGLYVHIENTGTKMDRIYGQLEVWSNKKGFCTSLRSVLRPWTSEGLEWMEKFTFSCWVTARDNQELFQKLNDDDYFSSVKGWVFKPENRGGGSGIYVKTDKSKVENDIRWWTKKGEPHIIQPLLANPLLINQRKFDLRTHVLVTSLTQVAPIRAYVHSNGIVRFAADAHDKDTRTSFLTNLSVNNKIANTQDLTWTFTELRQHLKHDAAKLFNRVDEAISQMLIATEKKFEERYSSINNGKFKCRTCYQQIGIDILVDSNLQVKIMEVNGNPMQNFKAEKITKLCQQFQSDITNLIYGPHSQDTSMDLVGSLEAVLTEGNDFESQYHWLDADLIEYLLSLQKEQYNLDGFRVVYPPSQAAFSISKQNEWILYLEHLGYSQNRIELHKLLIDLQRHRIENCFRDSNLDCSEEIMDIPR